MININIHNLIGLNISNSPKNISKFIAEEFLILFKNEVLKNILIKFRTKIRVPSDALKLNKNLYYETKLKIFYFIKDDKILSYNLSKYFKNKIFIEIEKSFNKWFFCTLLKYNIRSTL